MKSAPTLLVAAMILAAAPNLAYASPDSDSESEATVLEVSPTSTAGPPQCIDRSDVEGYRRCPRFGMWGDNLLGPNFFIEVGMNVRHFSSANATTATARSTTTPVTPAPGGEDDARTYVERFGFAAPHAYVAAEFEFGTFGAVRPGSRDLVLDGVVALGLRTRIGPLGLAGELDGGIMTYTYAYQSTQMSEDVVDARARAYLWLTPWCTAGAMLGTSLDHSEWVAGAYIGFHTYSFGGNP